MKGITHEELHTLGAQILLSNTYHLHLQPGENVVESAGGLHSFIGWDKPMLTDSGGFQVFSLESLRKISDAGVHFKNHLNGAPLFLDPASAMRIQHALGADIIMCFDHCPPSTASRAEILAATDRTIRWAAECKKQHERLKIQKTQRTQKIQKNDSSASSAFPLLFGIVQGGLERDLREKCAQELIAIGFDGYALGGLAVGESEHKMYGVVDAVCPLLPEDKPRYLMGVGVVEQLQSCVQRGIDMFDCVLPMRLARHGTILLSDGGKLRIKTSAFRTDHSPIDADSPVPQSRIFKRSYLHHLIRSGERFGETLACLQNLGITLHTMQQLRKTMDKTHV